MMLKSKIHRARVTDSNLYYEGSFTVDADIMEKADMLPYEKVSIVNINNGERFETYLIPGDRGSKVFCLNGAVARKGEIGDEIIIISYCNMTDKEMESYKPTLVMVDEDNNIKEITHSTEPFKLMKQI